MRRPVLASLAGLVLATTGCSDEPAGETAPPATPTSASVSSPPADPSTSPTTPSSTPTREPAAFDERRAMGHVRRLAGDIGPRLATGPAFREAAAYVEAELAGRGYDVRRQPFPVPGGDSWGVPVEAGRSVNVVATPPGFDPAAPHLVVGAHLDTVAVAPGAEDNASGISVLLELARTTGGVGTRLPTVLVAFGAEEPVGTGDLHHFGSKHYVAEMTAAERRSLRGMVSLDRVGVGGTVPLATFDGTPTRIRDQLAGVARRLGIPTVVGFNTTSDHESFAVEGLPAARVGSTDYDEYHSEDDLPGVVQPEQLRRVGRLLLSWLRGS